MWDDSVRSKYYSAWRKYYRDEKHGIIPGENTPDKRRQTSDK
ncbi:MAG TPA: hypothetical protein PK777_04560 [Thermoguttaceae bacterium]|nr:hypothetical protein [Thermoguttaceae bacterium]HPP52202.1 hypothetical protein [Thermoguttaceae bacterium]